MTTQGPIEALRAVLERADKLCRTEFPDVYTAMGEMQTWVHDHARPALAAVPQEDAKRADALLAEVDIGVELEVLRRLIAKARGTDA